MYRYFIATFLGLFALAFSAGIAHAQLDLGIKSDTGLGKKAAVQAGFDADTDETSLAQIIGTIIKAVLSLAGIIFTFLIAYAGDMWMAARGNAEQIEKAQKIIIGSIIGLILSLAAYTFSNFAVKAILERATNTGGDTVEVNPYPSGQPGEL